MKAVKNTFVLVLIAVLSLFFSCGVATEEKDDENSNQTEKTPQSADGKTVLHGQVKSASSRQDYFQNFVKAYVKSTSGSLQTSPARTIMPTFPSSDLTYSVYASSDGGTTKIKATMDETTAGNYSITIPTDGTYIFYAEISDSSKNVIYKGQTSEITIASGKISKSDGTTSETIDTIEAKPFQSDSGTGNAAIPIDASGTQITKIVAEWKKKSDSTVTTFTKSQISSDSDRTFTLYLSDTSNTNESISSGTYELSIYFYGGDSSSAEVYRVSNEIVQVYDNLTTSVCSGNASYFSGNSIKISSSVISGTAYVAGTSPSKLKVNKSGANGTYYAPFSSISDALAKVSASGSDTMTIYIDGTFDRSEDGVLAISLSSGTLNIYGLNGAENSVLTSSSGYGISVSSGSKVNLKDITVTKCAGGILNNGTLSLSGVLINGNTSNGNGGGVYNRSSLSVSDGTKITGNKANYGGGIYMGTDASLSLGGNVEISGNTKSSDSTVSDNLSLGTSAVTVSSALSGSIGISLQTALSVGGSQALTSGFATYNSSSDAETIFSSDDSAYSVSANSSGEATIEKSSVVWISASGVDTNSGTYDSPLKTFSAAYKLFSDAGTLSSSANVIKIKDNLSPTEGLNSNDYAITATIEGATGDDKSGKATIDLKSITYTHDSTVENASGFYISAAQNLTFKNISFTQSGTDSAYLYGAISVDNSSANVAIEDCDFTSLNAKGACSAIALNSGSLTLKNVSITGNKATLASGGTRTYAVGFEGGTLTLSGKVTISGNTESDGTTAGNVYVGTGLKLSLASDFDSESKIYFSAEDKPATSSSVSFATGYSLSATPSSIFVDDDGYVVSADSTTSTTLVITTSGGGSVEISMPDLTFAAALTDSTYTITATSGTNDVTTSVTDWSVKVAANGVDITDAAGFTVTATAGSKPTVVLPNGLVSGTYTIEVSGTYGGTVYSDSIEFTK